MSTKPTLSTRVSALESDVAEIRNRVSAILAALSVEAPAKPVTRKAQPKAAAKRKTTARKAPAKKAPVAAKPQVKALCKSTRVAFVAAAKAQGLADFAGMSTKAIAAMCLEEPALVPAGFRIGKGYADLLG